MKIFLLFSLIILTILFIGKRFLNAAKRNLFKDQAAWSGKDIKIKYRNSEEILKSNTNNNFLNMIANESKIYLDDNSEENEK